MKSLIFIAFVVVMLVLAFASKLVQKNRARRPAQTTTTTTTRGGQTTTTTTATTTTPLPKWWQNPWVQSGIGLGIFFLILAIGPRWVYSLAWENITFVLLILLASIGLGWLNWENSKEGGKVAQSWVRLFLWLAVIMLIGQKIYVVGHELESKVLAMEKDSRSMTVTAPAGGNWSGFIRIPVTDAFSINPQEGTIEIIVGGTGEVFSTTHNVPSGTIGDIKGKKIQIRSKDPGKEVLVDIIW